MNTNFSVTNEIKADPTIPTYNASKLQNLQIANTTPTNAQVLLWDESAGEWTPGNAAGAGSNATQLQGRAISSTAPTNTQVLTWNGSQWVPDDAAGAELVTEDTHETTFSGLGFTTPVINIKIVKCANMVTLNIPSFTDIAESSALSISSNTALPNAYRPLSDVAQIMTTVILNNNIQEIGYWLLADDGILRLIRVGNSVFFTGSGQAGTLGDSTFTYNVLPT